MRDTQKSKVYRAERESIEKMAYTDIGLKFGEEELEFYSFDVTTALHDDMKGGGDYPKHRSRVTLSREHFPRWEYAAETAGCMAVIRHGGMPIEILPRY